MSASIALQKDVSIAYLGPPGTFSHQAAYKRLGDSVAYVPQKQIDGKWLYTKSMHRICMLTLFTRCLWGCWEGPNNIRHCPLWEFHLWLSCGDTRLLYPHLCQSARRDILDRTSMPAFQQQARQDHQSVQPSSRVRTDTKMAFGAHSQCQTYRSQVNSWGGRKGSARDRCRCCLQRNLRWTVWIGDCRGQHWGSCR